MKQICISQSFVSVSKTTKTETQGGHAALRFGAVTTTKGAECLDTLLQSAETCAKREDPIHSPSFHDKANQAKPQGSSKPFSVSTKPTKPTKQ